MAAFQVFTQPGKVPFPSIQDPAVQWGGWHSVSRPDFGEKKTLKRGIVSDGRKWVILCPVCSSPSHLPCAQYFVCRPDVWILLSITEARKCC